MSHFDLPAGYRFAAIASGIKASGKLDMALICADQAAQCAGVFTLNKVIAAPLQVTKPRIATGRCQAILINSGNANACTGAAGKLRKPLLNYSPKRWKFRKNWLPLRQPG